MIRIIGLKHWRISCFINVSEELFRDFKTIEDLNLALSIAVDEFYNVNDRAQVSLFVGVYVSSRSRRRSFKGIHSKVRRVENISEMM